MRYADWIYSSFKEGYYPVHSLDGDESLVPDNIGHDTIDHLFLGYRVGGPMAELKALGSISWRKPSVNLAYELVQIITMYNGGIDFYGVKKKSPLLPDLVKDAYDLVKDEQSFINDEVWNYIQEYGQQFLDAGREKAVKVYGDRHTANYIEEQVLDLFARNRRDLLPIRFIYESGDVYVNR